MNNKGMAVAVVIEIVMGLFVLLIGVSILTSSSKMGTDAITYMGDGFKDYDGDGWPNMLDSCDCGSPANMPDEPATEGGRKYCIVDWSYAECNQLPEGTHLWKQVSSKFGGKEVCLYTDEGCFKYRLALDEAKNNG